MTIRLARDFCLFKYYLMHVGLCQSPLPPSQCVQTFLIERDMMDISIMPGVVNCFSCALDTPGPVAWLVEMDGELVQTSLSPDAVTVTKLNGSFLVIAMPDNYVLPGPSGRRIIACISEIDEQSFEARLISGT